MTFVLKQSIRSCVGEAEAIVLEGAVQKLTNSTDLNRDRMECVLPIQQVLCDLMEAKSPEMDEP